MTLKLLGLCGSLRSISVNRKLLREAARVFDPAEFHEADLRFPLYDGDLERESGVPGVVTRVAAQIADADAIIIASPEYNRSISGVLKNALDWISRTDGTPWRGKPVALMSAAAGRSGGEQAQTVLRSAMTPFRAHVLPGPELAIAQGADQFDASGTLINERYMARLEELMQALRTDATGRA